MIDVDDNIRSFFKSYKDITGFKYSKNYAVVVASQSIEMECTSSDSLNPSDPGGRSDVHSSTECYNDISQIEILTCEEYYERYGDACTHGSANVEQEGSQSRQLSAPNLHDSNDTEIVVDLVQDTPLQPKVPISELTIDFIINALQKMRPKLVNLLML